MDNPNYPKWYTPEDIEWDEKRLAGEKTAIPHCEAVCQGCGCDIVGPSGSIALCEKCYRKVTGMPVLYATIQRQFVNGEKYRIGLHLREETCSK